MDPPDLLGEQQYTGLNVFAEILSEVESCCFDESYAKFDSGHKKKTFAIFISWLIPTPSHSH